MVVEAAVIVVLQLKTEELMVEQYLRVYQMIVGNTVQSDALHRVS